MMQKLKIKHLDLGAGVLDLDLGWVDFDQFPQVAQSITELLNASILEKSAGADRHLWRLEFEGCELLLHGEHYSGAIWIELANQQNSDELSFIAQWLNGRHLT